MGLRDEIISNALRGKLSKSAIEITDETIDRVRDECAHIARTTYIDCAPEEQEIVDTIQQIIAENIERGLS